MSEAVEGLINHLESKPEKEAWEVNLLSDIMALKSGKKGFCDAMTSAPESHREEWWDSYLSFEVQRAIKHHCPFNIVDARV